MSLFSLKNKEIYVTYRINSNKNSLFKDPEPIIQAIYFFLYSSNMTTIKAESKTVPKKPIAITVPMIYKTRPLQQNKAESKTVPPLGNSPVSQDMYNKQAPPSKSHLLQHKSYQNPASLYEEPTPPSDITATHHFTDSGSRLSFSGSWVDYNLLPDFLRDYCLTKAYEMIEDAGR